MELGFLLKKIIGFWLMPLSLSVLFIALGLLLLWFSKRQTMGKIFTTCGLALLLLFSWQPVATQLLRPIEQTYAGFNTQQQVDYVVVLGNLVESDESVPQHSHLSSSATARILEGLRIARAQPNSMLIVSGYKGNNSVSCAQAYADFAISLGFDAGRIIKLEAPKDTKEEAEAVSRIIGDKSMALVTSASHMTRAFNFFKQQHLNATPAPTFYLAKQTQSTNLRFESSGLLKSERAIYEYIGLLWQWLKQ
jgi:uncharacterized SAM-binding protein YcdF (DUF218 family)